MGKIKESIQFIKSILLNWKYFLIFLMTTLIGFFIMYKFSLATVADKSLGLFVMMSGVNDTFINLLLLFIIAVLFGVFAALFVYKIKIVRQTSSTGILGTLGITVGLFSAGCPTCGAFLFSMIGMPLALFYLPFKGLELKVLSILMLLISNYLIARSLTVCKINKSTIKINTNIHKIIDKEVKNK